MFTKRCFFLVLLRIEDEYKSDSRINTGHEVRTLVLKSKKALKTSLLLRESAFVMIITKQQHGIG